MSDLKLILLKQYLDLRIASYEDENGVKLGINPLKIKFLVNSTPGVIFAHIGVITPIDYNSIDIWYDLTDIYCNISGSWKNIKAYAEEFNTTIIELYSSTINVYQPLSIEIAGLTYLRKAEQQTSEYKAYTVLDTGVKKPVKFATWSVLPAKKISISRNIITGAGILEFKSVSKNTTVTIIASTLSNNTLLTGSLDVSIELPIIEVTLISQSLKIVGKVSLYSGEISQYNAVLTNHFSNGSKFNEDVSDRVLWSNSFDSFSINASGNLIAPNIVKDQSINICAKLLATFTSTASLTIFITRKLVTEIISISGVSTLKELHSAPYTATIKLNTEEVIPNYNVSWKVFDSISGTIDRDGIFTSRDVVKDTFQRIFAIVHQKNVPDVHKFKDVLVLSVPSPVLTISGILTVVNGNTVNYTASISFDGITENVAPDWSCDSSIGLIDNSGLLGTCIVNFNTTGKVNANIMYFGYNVSATTSLRVLTLRVSPISLEIVGVDSILEGTTTAYTSNVKLADNSINAVVPIWKLSNTNHSIDEYGLFIASKVLSDESVTISASYTDGFESVSTTKDILVTDTIVVWTPTILDIAGITSILELNTSNYIANLHYTSNVDTVKLVPNVSVTWSASYGIILQSGKFTAPSYLLSKSSLITAIYSVPGGTDIIQTLPITIIKVLTLKLLTAELSPSSVFSGQPSSIKVLLTKVSGDIIDVTLNTFTSYVISSPKVTKVGNIISTNEVLTSTEVIFNISYIENEETVSTSVTLTLKVNIASDLAITPVLSTIYESEIIAYTAILTLTNNTTKVVFPTFTFGTPNIGTMVGNVFTSSMVNAETSSTVTAKYSGPNVDGNITSNVAHITVKDKYPISISIFNDSGLYYIPRNSVTVLKSFVITSSLNTVYPLNPVYEYVNPADVAYAKITFDPLTGFLKFQCLNVLAEKIVNIRSSYTDSGITVTATRAITISYTKALVSLEVTLPVGDIYENIPKVITVKEKYDDGSYGLTLTSGITWNTSSLFTITGNTVTFKPVTATTPFTITATHGNPAISGSVTGNILAKVLVKLNFITTGGTPLVDSVSPILNSVVRPYAIFSDGSYADPTTLSWVFTLNNLQVIVSDYIIDIGSANLGSRVTFAIVPLNSKTIDRVIKATANYSLNGVSLTKSIELTIPKVVINSIKVDIGTNLNINSIDFDPTSRVVNLTIKLVLSDGTIISPSVDNPVTLDVDNSICVVTGNNLTITRPSAQVTTLSCNLTITCSKQLTLNKVLPITIQAATYIVGINGAHLIEEGRTSQYTSILQSSDGTISDISTYSPIAITNSGSGATITKSGLLTMGHIYNTITNLVATYTNPVTGTTLLSSIFYVSVERINIMIVTMPANVGRGSSSVIKITMNGYALVASDYNNMNVFGGMGVTRCDGNLSIPMNFTLDNYGRYTIGQSQAAGCYLAEFKISTIYGSGIYTTTFNVV